MEETISIIVPVYNAEKHIKKCIDSIINQTYKELEIILVNDGSKDFSGEICDEYAKLDNRIKVIHKENGGVSTARNIGLQNANGRYTMFVDSDDYLDLNICEVLIKFLVENSCDIAIANKVFHKEGKIIKNILYNQEKLIRENEEKELFILDLLTSYYDSKMHKVQFLSCGVTAKLFKSSIIKDNKILFVESCKYGEDVLFNLRSFQAANRIGYIDYDGYNFNINSESSTHRYRNDWKDSHEIFINEIKQFLEAYNKDNRFFEAYEMMIVTRISALINSYFFNGNNGKKFMTSYREFKRYIKQDKYKKAIKNVKLELLTKKQKIVILTLRMHLEIIFTFMCYIKNKKGIK